MYNEDLTIDFLVTVYFKTQKEYVTEKEMPARNSEHRQFGFDSDLGSWVNRENMHEIVHHFRYGSVVLATRMKYEQLVKEVFLKEVLLFGVYLKVCDTYF